MSDVVGQCLQLVSRVYVSLFVCFCPILKHCIVIFLTVCIILCLRNKKQK